MQSNYLDNVEHIHNLTDLLVLKNQLPNAFSISSEPLNDHISYQLELYYVIHRGEKQPFEKLSDEA